MQRRRPTRRATRLPTASRTCPTAWASTPAAGHFRDHPERRGPHHALRRDGDGRRRVPDGEPEIRLGGEHRRRRQPRRPEQRRRRRGASGDHGNGRGQPAANVQRPGLPQGLTINPTAARSAGPSPDGGTSQPYIVMVTATDGQHSGSTNFAWDVSPPTLPDRTDVEGRPSPSRRRADYPEQLRRRTARRPAQRRRHRPHTGLISGAHRRGDPRPGRMP